MDGVESVDVASLIPHCGASVLLDHVVEHDGESTTTSIIVGSQSWLVREDGGVAPWLGIEYMAQSIAAHEGLVARSDGRTPPLGFLVSVVDFELHAATLRGGEQLEVCTRRVRGRPELGVLSHHCILYRKDADGVRDVIAQGRLSIAIPRQ